MSLMEKKIYIQPATQVVNVEQQAICAISEFNEKASTSGVSGAAALSKEEEDWDLWDEE